jgi:hypothetical protein
VSHDVRSTLPTVKMAAIKMIYEDGVLIVNDYRCTKRETLAVANLLLPDYRSIVGAAREEQRKHEADHHVRKVDRIEAL